ncbi:MAG: NAD(+)/NADH kinase [Ignavibacteria bacterium]|nr:MAG: NAD(+)/NADH kinase [Ignavibacteria bacterium]
MKIGIIPNLGKENIKEALMKLIKKLDEYQLEFAVSSDILNSEISIAEERIDLDFLENEKLCSNCDIIISIGGDGTMLNTAYYARKYGTPILGINFGKLGFLAEYDFNDLDRLVKDVKENNFVVEDRITLDAICQCENEEELFAINDIVIDRGRWPKMIELTLKVDDDYVSTFSADGIIISTPTGSTGYSLSTGGPIVNPKAKAITISPISPHTLTMRPLVLSSDQKITVEVSSHYSSVQVNCDGQRVNYYKPPVKIELFKSKYPLRLVHSKNTNYFDILRQKLFWGLDLRRREEQ